MGLNTKCPIHGNAHPDFMCPNKKTTPKVVKPMRICWVCEKRGRRYYCEHHVVLRENDMGLTVWLCRGCHNLVGRLAQYLRILREPHTLADVITLARFQAGLPDARTIVKYEEGRQNDKAE